MDRADKARKVFDALTHEEGDRWMVCNICYVERWFAPLHRTQFDKDTWQIQDLFRCRTCGKNTWVVEPIVRKRVISVDTN